MFERTALDAHCVLVHVDTAPFARDTQADHEEFVELAHSAGLQPQTQHQLRRRTPHPRFYFGPGQAEKLHESCMAHDVRLLALNVDLSPSQERNLEERLQCRVLGRTGLILDIFAQRARSHEGKLQVELAQLTYLSTRLVRGWSHLERQKGGIGLRGPGETQLELDRRLLTRRLQTLRHRLVQVESQRRQSRMRRQREDWFHVTLVGYTNAGKSTLFNYLTGSDVSVQDKLFATLDPTHRRLPLAQGPATILSDTVGFIQGLPMELVRAFHSTLEEVRDCDLLLHVIDRSDPEYEQRVVRVRDTLGQIGAAEVPVLEVYNKTDRLPEGSEPPAKESAGRVWISARTGEGTKALCERIAQSAMARSSRAYLRLPADAYPLRAELHRLGQVEAEWFTETGECEMRLWLPQSRLEKYAQFRVSRPTQGQKFISEKTASSSPIC